MAALDFYDDLELDNTKTFWSAHKSVYDTAVRAPMVAMVSALADEFGPGKVFRPYRDVRFAKDKTPYKNHQGGFCAHGESTGWYVQVDARGVHVSAGTYATSPRTRTALREAVDSPRGARLQRLLDDLVAGGWSVQGEQLKTRPRGCAADHPRLALMRHNSVWVTFDYGFDPQMGEAIGAVTDRCRGILLGRTTYEMFEQGWSTRTVEDDPGAPFFNDTTKYVVSGTLTTATWRNSEIVGPYDPDTIRRLKEEVDGDLYVSGSGTLVRAMLADGLVDELHLFLYPTSRGGGPRLFPEGAAPSTLSLAASESYDNGVVYLNYRAQA